MSKLLKQCGLLSGQGNHAFSIKYAPPGKSTEQPFAIYRQESDYAIVTLAAQDSAVLVSPDRKRPRWARMTLSSPEAAAPAGEVPPFPAAPAPAAMADPEPEKEAVLAELADMIRLNTSPFFPEQKALVTLQFWRNRRGLNAQEEVQLQDLQRKKRHAVRMYDDQEQAAYESYQKMLRERRVRASEQRWADARQSIFVPRVREMLCAKLEALKGAEATEQILQDIQRIEGGLALEEPPPDLIQDFCGDVFKTPW